MKFIIRNFYSAYIAKDYYKGEKYAFTRDQSDILTFGNKEEAEKFIENEMKEYVFDDLEVIEAHF